MDKHLDLRAQSRAVFTNLIQYPDTKFDFTPTLLHPDLHESNIFVAPDNPTTITGFIDWQSVSLELAFEYDRDSPDFASIPQERTPETQNRASATKRANSAGPR